MCSKLYTFCLVYIMVADYHESPWKKALFTKLIACVIVWMGCSWMWQCQVRGLSQLILFNGNWLWLLIYYIIWYGKWRSPTNCWPPVWRPCYNRCIKFILKQYYHSVKMIYDLWLWFIMKFKECSCRLSYNLHMSVSDYPWFDPLRLNMCAKCFAQLFCLSKEICVPKMVHVDLV